MGQGFVGWLGESYDPIKTWGINIKQQPEVPLNSGKQMASKENVQAENEYTKWKKDVSEEIERYQNIETEDEEISKRGPKQDSQWIEQLSWEPRSFIFYQFLTEEECDHISNLSRPFVNLFLFLLPSFWIPVKENDVPNRKGRRIQGGRSNHFRNPCAVRVCALF